MLRTIRDRPIRKAAPILLEVAPYLDNWDLSELVADAVTVVVPVVASSRIVIDSPLSKVTVTAPSAGFVNVAV